MAGAEANLALGEPQTFFCPDKACSDACSSHSQHQPRYTPSHTRCRPDCLLPFPVALLWVQAIVTHRLLQALLSASHLNSHAPTQSVSQAGKRQGDAGASMAKAKASQRCSLTHEDGVRQGTAIETDAVCTSTFSSRCCGCRGRYPGREADMGQGRRGGRGGYGEGAARPDRADRRQAAAASQPGAEPEGPKLPHSLKIAQRLFTGEASLATEEPV